MASDVEKGLKFLDKEFNMSYMKNEQSRFAVGGGNDTQPIERIEFLPGETFGPSVGISIALQDKSSRVVEMHVDEAFDFALQILEAVRQSEGKFESKYGHDWRAKSRPIRQSTLYVGPRSCA